MKRITAMIKAPKAAMAYPTGRHYEKITPALVVKFSFLKVILEVSLGKRETRQTRAKGRLTGNGRDTSIIQ